MESESLKLSLNLSPPWLIGEQSTDPVDSSELLDYIARLEQELRKVESFKRELPISVLLLTNAIARFKEDVRKSDKEQVRAACDLNESPREGSEVTVSVDGDKKTWMRSAQLWSSDQTSFLHLSPKRKRNGAEDKAGAFSSFTEGSEISPAREDVDRNKPALSRPPLRLQVASEPVSGLKVGGGDRGTGDVGQNTFVPILPAPSKPRRQASPTVSPSLVPKKLRRCWSKELHRQFVDALEKLGGSRVATPRQIKDLMQVKGLTNDEVKSHLQKYRLHIRRLPNSVASTSKIKLNSSQSVSPQGPLNMAIRSVLECNSAASRCHSIEEDGVEKSDSHSWGGH